MRPPCKRLPVKDLGDLARLVTAALITRVNFWLEG